MITPWKLSKMIFGLKTMLLRLIIHPSPIRLERNFITLDYLHAGLSGNRTGIVKSLKGRPQFFVNINLPATTITFVIPETFATYAVESLVRCIVTEYRSSTVTIRPWLNEFVMPLIWEDSIIANTV